MINFINYPENNLQNVLKKEPFEIGVAKIIVVT